MAEITKDVVKGLAAKLDSLDLDDAEQAALDDILARAEAYEPEVEGFGFSTSGFQLQSGAGLSGTSLKLAGGLGFVTRPSLGYQDPFDPKDPTKPPPP